jgi:hypothetical protein
LQEYSKVQRAAKELDRENDEVRELKEKHAFVMKQRRITQQNEDKVQQNKAAAGDAFWQALEKSDDPYDNLEGLAQHIHDNIGSTGVYIGQLEAPRVKIQDDSASDAHLDKSSPQVIKFKFANSDHKELIVNTVLKPGVGVSHEVFSDKITENNEKIDLSKPENICEQFKHMWVPEVIREPKMHYWTVPRLGSFMAVPLVYKSYLNINSFDKAVKDWKAY